MLRVRRTRGSGGTGRRARLRGVWFTPYGFKSRFPHQQKKESIGSPFFVGLDNWLAESHSVLLAKRRSAEVCIAFCQIGMALVELFKSLFSHKEPNAYAFGSNCLF